MPQMSPMDWSLLYMYFLLLYFFVLLIMYFIYMNYMINNKKKLFLNKNNYNLKWY